ncbi:response regulator [Pseudarthrobacter sp. NPDC058329]|uniref:response regulator n=1 Tax=Pseudarthrobacter sp. NPDC058329 TaxID=3346448 RepID=UPI0036DA7DB7
MAQQNPALEVLIVDDHAVVRRGIKAYFEVLDDIEAVDEATDGQEALEKLSAMAAYGELPDVVLMDLMMPRLDGVSATAEITRLYPSVKVVILTSFGETERLHAALDNGASGYLLKDAGPTEVAGAIRAASRDEVFIDSAVAKQLARSISSPPTGIALLTRRERDVLKLVAEGRSNQEIARELSISERTARTHVSNLLGKLNLRSRTQAALVAVRAGLLPPAG